MDAVAVVFPPAHPLLCCQGAFLQLVLIILLIWSLRFSQGVHRVHQMGGTLGMQRDPHSHRVLHAQEMIRHVACLG